MQTELDESAASRGDPEAETSANSLADDRPDGRVPSVSGAKR
jgi:hypothetical protein